MHLKHLAVAGLMAVALTGTGLGTAAYADQAMSTATVDDSTLHSRINTAIKNSGTLEKRDIDVNVDNHVVTLTGFVHTAAEKTRAARVANITGVTRVDNQLVVDPKHKDLEQKVVSGTKTAAEKTGDAAKVVGEKTKEGAVATGGAIKGGAEATGEVVTDAWINTKIHTDMVNEPTLKGSSVNVDVNDHVVTLKGTVASAAGKARAEEIAKTTKGVKSVRNTLVVSTKS